MAVEVEWRSFLLRPEPDPNRTFEKFKAYTKSWESPAAMEPRAGFRVWASSEGPPTHSIPPHVVAKAAERLDVDAAARLRWALFEAYFQQNRDITARPVLRSLWDDAGLPGDRFEDAFAPGLGQELLMVIGQEHMEATRYGVTGVPAVRRGDEVVVGAQPVEAYRAWLSRE